MLPVDDRAMVGRARMGGQYLLMMVAVDDDAGVILDAFQPAT